jgi:hypothetical protein
MFFKPKMTRKVTLNSILGMLVFMCLLMAVCAAFGDAGYGRGPESDTIATNAMASKIGADAYLLDLNTASATALNGYTVSVSRVVMFVNSTGSADSETNIVTLADPGTVGRLAILYNAGTSNSLAIESTGNFESPAMVLTPKAWGMLCSRATNKWAGLGSVSAGWWPEQDTTATNAMAAKIGADANLLDLTYASAYVLNTYTVNVSRSIMLLSSIQGTNQYTNIVVLADPGVAGRFATLYNAGTSNQIAIDNVGNWGSSKITIAPGALAQIFAVATNKWAGK